MPEAQLMRVLMRAVWWLRAMGAILLLGGGLLALAAAEQMNKSLRIPAGERALFVALASAIALLPGLCYWVLSIFVRRLQSWAVGGAVLVSWFQICFAATIALAALIAPRQAWPLMVLALVWAALLAMVIRRVRAAEPAMHLLSKQAARGFEPLAIRSAGW